VVDAIHLGLYVALIAAFLAFGVIYTARHAKRRPGL
jgi:hypothetical protein